MNDWMYYSGLFFFLCVISQLYFWIAVRYGIIDKPNERSSHVLPTIRGGGVVFPLAMLFYFLFNNSQAIYFILGVIWIAGISFWDDIRSSSASVRVIIHAMAIGLLFYAVSFWVWPWWILALAFVVCVGALSAFNFMDGINGITGIYALVTLSTFAYVADSISFTNQTILGTSLISVIIFLFYNFRTKARCFAGDVGSVSLAFIQIFMLMSLINVTQNLWWVLLFFIFGIDSVMTILIRIAKRENIFKPHRSHLYQVLANEGRINHLVVSSAYGVAQIIINLFLIYFISISQPAWILIPVFIFLAVYISLRISISRRAIT